MDLPEKSFRLRPAHALILLDLALLAGLFLLGGRLYMNIRATKVIASKQQERAAVQLEGAALLVQADSVVASTDERLNQVVADSTESIEGLRELRKDLDRRVAETQRLSQGIYRLSDVVLDLRQRAEGALRQASRDEGSVKQRRLEVDSLVTTERATHETLTQTRGEHARALEALARAQAGESYDPTGRFPATTGLALRRDVGDEVDLTNLLLQQVVWNKGLTDVGLSLGWGLGTEESVSNKEIGILVSRSLIHRRLGLDLGAGFSRLTRSEGDDDNSPYASAGLRLSPFYKERLHLGLGARANHDEIVPFLGFGLGRR